MCLYEKFDCTVSGVRWLSLAWGLGVDVDSRSPLPGCDVNMVIGPKMVQAPGRALHRLEVHLCIRI